MSRCMCCNKEIVAPDKYEAKVLWHRKCIKAFFKTTVIPEINCSDQEIERLAELSINKGLTVPGVQKKLSLHLDNTGRTARLTIVDYPTGYILKPQSSEYDCLPETEFLSMKMAEIVGIKTVPHALIISNERFVYITRRIDRVGNKMYAMEDFCQLSERMTADKYRSSYENCGKVIKKHSKNIGLDLTELYYRLLFCFLTGNSDMHLKNFSLIEDKPGSRSFSLSAAYDMLPVNIVMPADKEEMALTLNGKKRNLRRKDFLILADNLEIQNKAASQLISHILKFKDSLIKEVGLSYIPKDMQRQMIELIEKRALKLQ